MKKYLEYFKIPLMIFAVILVIGIACKIVADRRPIVKFERNNEQCTTQRVFDYANKLTEEQEKELQDKIAETEKLCGTDIIVVTLEESLEGYAKSYEHIIGRVQPYEYTMVYADNFYDEHAFGYDKPHGDGVILVDNWYREADGGVYSWMSTSGRAMEQLSAEDIDIILDLCLESVEDDPAYAYGYFVELAEDYLNPNKRNGEAMGGIFSVLIGLVAGIVFFFVNFGGKKGKKTVESRTYVRSGMAQTRERQDIFITKTVSRRKIETSDSNSSGGHISAGGHSHGGGGHSR